MTTPLVHITTLGCARNDTDSEQLAGALVADGLGLTDDPAQADVILVNTCGFIDAAKKDSIDVILGLADVSEKHHAKLVATGCMAQRYGDELAANLPELAAVIGFADYPSIGTKMREIIGVASPIKKPTTQPTRVRLETGPFAPLKIASGCDRRCAFCAIPGFRGKYQSRPIDEVVAEAGWLVTQGVREVMLVSENSSSYGKDLGDRWALIKLLRRLSEVDGLDWVRVSYLQPAEITPALLDAMTSTPRVVPYFDISFQHASGPLLRRMRRFGDAPSFLHLLDQVRERCPAAGVRTSVIVGFPGETDDDLALLHDFLGRTRADAIGVFAYSDEEGTGAYTLDGHLSEDVISQRATQTGELATWLVESRAAERIGESVDVLVESLHPAIVGRAAHQGPEVDGTTRLDWPPHTPKPAIGDLVPATITAAEGVDLVASPIKT